MTIDLHFLEAVSEMATMIILDVGYIWLPMTSLMTIRSITVSDKIVFDSVLIFSKISEFEYCFN